MRDDHVLLTNFKLALLLLIFYHVMSLLPLAYASASTGCFLFLFLASNSPLLQERESFSHSLSYSISWSWISRSKSESFISYNIWDRSVSILIFSFFFLFCLRSSLLLSSFLLWCQSQRKGESVLSEWGRPIFNFTFPRTQGGKSCSDPLS